MPSTRFFSGRFFSGRFFSGLILFVCVFLFQASIATAQSEATTTAGIATSSELTPAFLRDSDQLKLPPVEIPEPIAGKGKLSVSIETFSGENPKRVGQLADRAELWLGYQRLASLNRDFDEVDSERNRRVFNFPEIVMHSGYYFITVRLYSPGALHGRQKSHEQTFQVGIHPDRISRVYKKMPFFHW